jgi:rubrerythrin
MIEINPQKIVHVIYLAREGHLAAPELRAFIADLNDDEKAHLVGLAWVGRGAFEAEEFDEAVATARTEATTPTEDYLMGMPHLSENLEAGMEAMGLDVSDEEEDFLDGDH